MVIIVSRTKVVKYGINWKTNLKASTSLKICIKDWEPIRSCFNCDLCSMNSIIVLGYAYCTYHFVNVTYLFTIYINLITPSCG